MLLPQHVKRNPTNWVLFSCSINFYFEFLMLSIRFSISHKNGRLWLSSYGYHFSFWWKMENEIQFIFPFFVFMKELKNELLEDITINFMVIFTSIVYTLFKSNVESSPRRFSAVQWSQRQQESAVLKTAGVF